MNTQCSSATAERGLKKKKKEHGRRDPNLFVSCIAQNLASIKHRHILGLTHAQTKSQLRSETEWTNFGKKKYQLPQSEGTQIPNIAWKQVDKYNAILRKVEEKKADEERIK